MAVTDKHLITLKLILKQFGIDVGLNFDQTSDSNHDLIAACVALIQVSYPLNYKFEIVKISGKHRVRSTSLYNEVGILSKKNSNMQFAVAEKQYALRNILMQKIKKVGEVLKIPEGTKLTQAGWLCLLGFCAVAQRELSETKFLRIMTNEYRELIPYLDIANERIKELKFEK